MSYANNKTWRIRHPEKRQKDKRAYYAKHRENIQNQENSRQEWTLLEINRITAPDRPADSILAKQIGRSVQAVQEKRAQLRKIR